MTQEEKAKAYDEALKHARFYHGNCPSEPEKKKLEEMFPVLRESEKERIINQLIHLVQNTGEVIPIPDNKEELLDYLKKQKDASKAIEAVDRIDKYIDEHLANAHDMKDSNPDKKYYLGWDDALAEMARILQDVYSNEKQKEQKPEQYSPLCNTIKDKIREYVANHFATDTVVKTDVKSIVKAMKEGVRLGKEEQKPAQWSEEDEKHINIILRVLDRQQCWDGATGKKFNPYQDEIDWLKSLRPKPHWKPSEEQIDALKNVIRISPPGENNNILISLLNDLEKQM